MASAMFMMRAFDLTTALAYLSLSLKAILSLYRYYRAGHRISGRTFVPLTLACSLLFLESINYTLHLCAGTKNVFINALISVVSCFLSICLVYLLPHLLKHDWEQLATSDSQSSKQQLISFMAFLCHELKTPLFCITSTISFLRDDDDKLTQEQRESLEAIKRSSDVMLRVMNNVLDINNLETAKVELEIDDIDLFKYMNHVHRGMGMKCTEVHEDRVRFSYHIAQNLESTLVRGDSVRIIQIMHTLLSNAIKFTEHGHVISSVDTISTSEALKQGLIIASDSGSRTGKTKARALVRESARSDELCGSNLGHDTNDSSFVLRIRVEDSGTGIPDDRLNSIFKPFCETKLNHYREFGGTGLGLALTSKLVKMMGGTISVKSSSSSGSTFQVHIPLEVSRVEMDPLALKHTTQRTRRKVPELLNASVHTCETFKSIEVSELAAMESSISSFDGDCGPPAVPSSNNTCSQAQTLFTGTLQGALLQMSDASFGSRSDDLDGAASCSTEPLIDKKSNNVRIFDSTSLPPSKKNVVLIVDDNNTNRKIIGRMLASFKIEYLQASNGQEAVDTMLHSYNYTGDPCDPHFACIIMDISMPIMDGCEATATIRSHNLPIPIIALTAATVEDARARAFSAGATEYATKPISREELYQKCTKYLRQYGTVPSFVPSGHGSVDENKLSDTAMARD